MAKNAAKNDHIAFLEDCLKHIPEIRFKAMFGGHALYCSERVVGLVGDQTLFIKMTPGTTKLLNGLVETGPPYPGAKDAYVMAERECLDATLIMRVITACRDDVAPAPKKIKKTAKKR
jgi:TfoX/Sxy family transcriptional regulator of competence genes